MRRGHSKARGLLFLGALALAWVAGPAAALKAVDKAPSTTPFTLYDPGQNGLVDYTKYGRFYGIGTAQYQYVMSDRAGLARAVGEGIFPNTSAEQDPAFLRMRAGLDFHSATWGLWLGNLWDPQKQFFQWVCGKVDDATKTMDAARIFMQCQMWIPALKAFDAVLIQFPTASRANSKDPWTWYACYGSVARNSILYILRQHPELGLELKDCVVDVANPGKDNQKVNKVNPGYFVRAQPTPPVRLESVIKELPNADAKVRLVQYQNHHWMMWVDGQPYFIRGLCYGVTKIGQSPDLQNMVSLYDVPDLHGVFDSWVDKNHNDHRDADEPVVGDQVLLKQMGCNTIRCYYGEDVKTTANMERFWKDDGIRFAIGTGFGAYGMDSGGGWDKGTDYTDPAQQDAILDALKKTVLRFKDKPYTLCYILGNENNYGVKNNSNTYPAVYCNLIERACLMVHKLDPNHPVGPCIGEGYADQVIRYAPDVDFIGINSYRGATGFGDLWETLRAQTDKPVIITEFGAPAYYNGVGEDGLVQADYLKGNWEDMRYNRGGGPGYGNALGGFVFEWQDEWWKAENGKPPNVHDTSKGQGDAPFADGAGHEEWYGITGQGDGYDSPAMRHLRDSYFVLKSLWTKEEQGTR